MKRSLITITLLIILSLLTLSCSDNNPVLDTRSYNVGYDRGYLDGLAVGKGEAPPQ